MIGFNGGLIGKDRTPAPRSTTISGVWSLREQITAVRRGTWTDPFFQSVYVLLHFDGVNGATIVDSGPAARTITSGPNVRISTDFSSKFGGSAVYFDGINSGDAISFADPALGTGNFTIEFWMKSNGDVQYTQLIGNEVNGTTQGYTLLINNNSPTGGQISLYVLQTGPAVLETSTGDWTDDAWHHIALVRSGNSFTLYTDGTANGTGTSTATLNGSATATVGRNFAYPPRNYRGFFDEFRITKGIARYTSNFTPQTISFPDL